MSNKNPLPEPVFSVRFEEAGKGADCERVRVASAFGASLAQPPFYCLCMPLEVCRVVAITAFLLVFFPDNIWQSARGMGDGFSRFIVPSPPQCLPPGNSDHRLSAL